MEHRMGSRRAIRTSVVLYAKGAPAVISSTREVSISGMFVAADPALFCDNSVIDVEVTLPGATGLHAYRWQAMVIRRTTEGIGLMFDRLRPPAIMALLEKAQTDPDFPGLVLAAAPPKPNHRSIA